VGHANPYPEFIGDEERKGPMTQKRDKSDGIKRKELIGNQEDFLRPLVREVIQQVLEAEMEEVIDRSEERRTAERVGYRAGYYGRTLVTRVGKLELRVPQDRQGGFRTELFERYQRSEKALLAALAEMYVQPPGKQYLVGPRKAQKSKHPLHPLPR